MHVHHINDKTLPVLHLHLEVLHLRRPTLSSWFFHHTELLVSVVQNLQDKRNPWFWRARFTALSL